MALEDRRREVDRHFGHRYISVSTFTGMLRSFGLRNTDSTLEYYEKERFLFPKARAVIPAQYFRLRMNSDEPCTLGNAQINAIKRLKFQTRLDVHPTEYLDDEFRVRNPFLIRPEKRPFVAWRKYRVPVKHGTRTLFENAADVYYPYWAIYRVFQLQRLADPAQFDFLARHLDRKRAICRTWVKNYKRLYRPKPGSWKPDPLLEAISLFRNEYSFIFHQQLTTRRPDRDGLHSIDVRRRRRIEADSHTAAVRIARRVGLSPSSFVQDLRQLTHLHFEAENRSPLICDWIERDLRTALSFGHSAWKLDADALCKQDGALHEIINGKEYWELQVTTTKFATYFEDFPKRHEPVALARGSEECRKEASRFMAFADKHGIGRLPTLLNDLRFPGNEYGSSAWHDRVHDLLRETAAYTEYLAKELERLMIGKGLILPPPKDTLSPVLERVFHKCRWYQARVKAHTKLTRFTPGVSPRPQLTKCLRRKCGSGNLSCAAGDILTCLLIRNVATHEPEHASRPFRGYYSQLTESFGHLILLMWTQARQLKLV